MNVRCAIAPSHTRGRPWGNNQTTQPRPQSVLPGKANTHACTRTIKEHADTDGTACQGRVGVP